MEELTYYEKNKDYIKAQHIEYKSKNIEKIKAKQKEYRKNYNKLNTYCKLCRKIMLRSSYKLHYERKHAEKLIPYVL
tara:strand:- start:1767 stop:1997 length:231 start_codon:yes stop_codon:yes gene_type:complete